MADTVRFIFGIHNHQPVGNFDWVFREAWEKAYRPFVEIAERHPAVALTFHFSGPILEWLEANEPSFLDRISRLAQRGNVEIFSGGFYEPVLAVIPDRDKIGQIEKLNRYVRERFNYIAEGLWLTERVWEPHLAKPIHETGIKYVTVDDFHFLSAGLTQDELTGYFITEEQNAPLGVFPISQRLRYTIPFKEPEETLKVLRKAARAEGDITMVMADDGEKFGLWPGTYGRCYGRDQWLERFFQALEENSDWITTTTFSRVFNNEPPKGRVYLPTASYFEMSQWTLPAVAGELFDDFVQTLEDDGRIDEVRPFVRCGSWRNFLAKYPESNWMQKRVAQVSSKLAAAQAKSVAPDKLAQARDDLWRSQCNCAYWHGIFGGLYLPHLRHAVYEHLLKAETAIEDGTEAVRITRQDLDLDGVEEVELATNMLKAFITPQGGALCELDILPAHFNLLNTLRQYPESYHRKIASASSESEAEGSIHDLQVAKEPDLHKSIQVDTHPRYSLLDHFYTAETTVEMARTGKAREEGTFPGTLFDVNIAGETVVLNARGRSYGQEVEVTKPVQARGDTLSVEVRIANQGRKALQGLYTLEFNFSLLGGHAKDRYYLVNGKKPRKSYLDAVGEIEGVGSLGVVSEWEGVRAELTFAEPVTIWRYPVMTVSLSESGYERVYQSSVVLPVFRLDVLPGQTFATQLSLQALKQN